MFVFLFNNCEELGFKEFKEGELYAHQRSIKIVNWVTSNTMPVTHKYTFSDGKIHEFSRRQAKLYEIMNNCKITDSPMVYSCKDIYKGFNHGLGIEIEDRAHYKRILKERGEEEIGNEDISKIFKQPPRKEFVTDEILKEAWERGERFSGEEASALKSGKDLSNPETRIKENSDGKFIKKEDSNLSL